MNMEWAPGFAESALSVKHRLQGFPDLGTVLEFRLEIELRPPLIGLAEQFQRLRTFIPCTAIGKRIGGGKFERSKNCTCFPKYPRLRRLASLLWTDADAILSCGCKGGQ